MPKLKSVLKPLVLVMLLVSVFAGVLAAPVLQAKWMRHRVASRVFEIKGTKDGGGGTGFQVEAPSGTYIVTNSHVCEYAMKDGKDNNFLLVQKDKRFMKRRILEVSDSADLCLVEGWPGLSGLKLGDSPEVGDAVTAIGHPRLGPTTATAGEVVGSTNTLIIHHMMPTGNAKLDAFLGVSNEPCNQPKNEIHKQMLMLFGMIPVGEVRMCLVKETDAVQTNVTIFPGSSGSPLVDRWGRVVGVVFAADQQTNWGFAVNLSHLKHFLADF